MSAKPTAAPAREPRRITFTQPPRQEKKQKAAKPKKSAEGAPATTPPVTAAKAPKKKQAVAAAAVGAGGAASEAEPAPAVKPAAKPKGKPKSSKSAAPKAPKPKGGKIPGPQKLEKEVQNALERDARGLPPEDYVIFGDTSFESMVEQLRQLKQILDKTSSAPILSALECEDAAGNKVVDRMMKMGARDLMDYLDANGRPDLKRKFEALEEWARIAPWRRRRSRSS